MKRTALLIFATAMFAAAAHAQGNTQAQNAPAVYSPPVDPLGSIAIDMAHITKSVNSLTTTLKSFVDKFEKVGGTTFNEKQQRLVLGLEFLVRAEERLAILQRTQIEFTEKQAATRARLAQVDRDLFPQSIDRNFALEGTTRTEEMRESRRNTLTAERKALQDLLRQIDSTLAETAEGVRDAEAMVRRLRRQYLPQIEREIFEAGN